MSTGSIITGIVLLILCALPFVIFNKYNKSKKNKSLRLLSDLASESGAKLTKQEYWHGAAAGIDEQEGIFFLLRKANKQWLKCTVHLQNMNKARIIRSEKSTNSGSSLNTISRIDMAFTPKEKDRPETLIEFYNAEYDSVNPYHEQQLIEKWHSIIDDFLVRSNMSNKKF